MSEVKEFPPHVSKDKLAAALKLSPSALQDILNRRFIDDLQKIGYESNSKLVSRKVLQFLCDKIALIPEDFC